jgi:D-serine deaminase-like pyridoxal phosphate-dependent protein
VIRRLSEEHAQVEFSSGSRRPELGERVTIIPNHICPCVNLQDELWWRESDGSIRPIRVDARGKLS